MWMARKNELASPDDHLVQERLIGRRFLHEGHSSPSGGRHTEIRGAQLVPQGDVSRKVSKNYVQFVVASVLSSQVF